jgi:hypothetical protein
MSDVQRIVAHLRCLRDAQISGMCAGRIDEPRALRSVAHLHAAMVALEQYERLNKETVEPGEAET